MNLSCTQATLMTRLLLLTRSASVQRVTLGPIVPLLARTLPAADMECVVKADAVRAATRTRAQRAPCSLAAGMELVVVMVRAKLCHRIRIIWERILFAPKQIVLEQLILPVTT